MTASLESARPIMAPSVAGSNRNTARFSTYSAAPSEAATVRSTDTTSVSLNDIGTRLERMRNPALTSQRCELSEERADDFRKLALGARLDRSLDRRMSNQDAELPKRLRGKSVFGVPVTLDEEKSEDEKDAQLCDDKK